VEPLPLNFVERTEYIAGTAGSSTFRIHVREVGTPANGWDLDVPFTVEQASGRSGRARPGRAPA
jgi:hypothetical protein